MDLALFMKQDSIKNVRRSQTVCRFYKVGNLANDGIKLATGAKERRCSMIPHDGLEEEARGGTLRALWTHGGPTAAFVHILIAMCLLLPRLLLEARIIENGLLPQGN
ncbi:hypothetical protein GQX74_014542 [Glossina fuscipes]|nr:hypothetical protein GQX74_014542 [Glossina fuscipes]